MSVWISDSPTIQYIMTIKKIWKNEHVTYEKSKNYAKKCLQQHAKIIT